MKQIAIVLIVCLLIPISLCCQESGPIVTEKAGLKKTYTQNGIALKTKDLGVPLKSYPASSEMYSNYVTYSTVGSVLIAGGALVAGGGSLYYTIKEAQALNNNDLAAQSEYSKKGIQMLGVGIVCMVAGLPFTIFASKHLTKSIAVYNTQFNTGINRTYQLEMGVTQHGLGFRLCF
ncbi:MAG: hypothetical protein KAT15_15165 [Bacteroidales bacterium]|nr:hypothetical protein [Bacteroidales bacterium]